MGSNNAKMCKLLLDTESDVLSMMTPSFDALVEDVEQPEVETGVKTTHMFSDLLGYKEVTGTKTLIQYGQDITYEEAVSGKPKEKENKYTKSAYKIDEIKNLMTELNTQNAYEISNRIQEDCGRNKLLKWRSIVTAPNFKTVLSQAIQEKIQEERMNGETYLKKFILNCPAKDGTLTPRETQSLFTDWCAEQNIDRDVLLAEMYAVLGMKNPKRNCLMLQGGSNAGKTYWSRALCPFDDATGQTVQSTNFVWQKCVNKDVIIIPELSLIKPKQVEECKKIFEGFDTMVNVKNKEPTPVILQCNQTPWSRSFSQERMAFLNRMYSHLDLTPSTVLRQTDKMADPRYFQYIFQYMDEIMNDKPTWNYEQNDPYWKILVSSAKEANAKTKEDDVHDGDFRKHLLITEERYGTRFERRVTQLLEGGSRLMLKKQEERYDTDSSSTDFHVAMCAYLVAISTVRMNNDVYWDVMDYRKPILMNSLTKRPYAYDDISLPDYDYFREALAHLDYVYEKMPPTYKAKSLEWMVSEGEISMIRIGRCVKEMMVVLRDIIDKTKFVAEKERIESQEFQPMSSSTPVISEAKLNLVVPTTFEYSERSVAVAKTATGTVYNFVTEYLKPDEDQQQMNHVLNNRGTVPVFYIPEFEKPNKIYIRMNTFPKDVGCQTSLTGDDLVQIEPEQYESETPDDSLIHEDDPRLKEVNPLLSRRLDGGLETAQGDMLDGDVSLDDSFYRYIPLDEREDNERNQYGMPQRGDCRCVQNHEDTDINEFLEISAKL